MSAVRQASPIERGPRTGRDPVSLDQRRLWLLDQINVPSSAYHLYFCWRMVGELEVDVLQDALDEIVARHETLRTSFGVFDGEPVQVVSERGTMPVAVEDLSSVAEPEREAAAAAAARAEVERPFDLARGPLARVRLLRLAPDHHVFVLVMHHIVSDAWSIAVLFRELAVLYEAFLDGEPSPLPELPVQYADYARWQRERLDDETVRRHVEFWRAHLEGSPAMLELPTDKPRPPVQTFEGGLEPFAIEGELLERAKAFTREERASLFMVLQAVFAALLSRYSGQDTVVIGSPTAMRTRPELAEVIGFFVNTFVLRADLSGAPSFRELVRRVRSATLAALSHLELPFDRLVEALQPQRHLSVTPLFQVEFILVNDRYEQLELPGLTVTEYRAEQESTAYDLNLRLVETARGVFGELGYATALFEHGTAARIASHYRALLAAALADPDAPVHSLPLLSPEERAEVLELARGPVVEGWVPVQRLVEERAAASPGAAALVFEGRVLSYGELNGWANRLARRLHALGVGPEAVVGVFCERSFELVVGLLAVLKAGGAFLPLDPDYPPERVGLMVEDARPELVLAGPSVAGRLPELEAPVLVVGEEPEEDGSDLGLETTAGQAAYVLFTSGSTGRPKGAVNTHRGLANRLRWMQDTYPLGERDALVQLKAIGWDVAIAELFAPLVAGARLVLPRPDGHRDPDYVADLIASEQATVVHFVPSMLRVFLDLPDLAERCRSLKRVLCSGEALSLELQERFFSRLDVELHNLYGPTEAAIEVTHWRCERDYGRRSVPIGRPIANTQAYVLDDRLEPVSTGMPGELYLGGVQVARGYLHRPALTAERFVPDPFADEPGRRLYRTGDRARALPDATIEYLGRLDDQVKLRGMRVEPGEIEAALAEHPAVRHAAVVLREDEPGGGSLVGYVVAQDGSDADALGEQLQAFLRRRLPDYMVPSAFLALAELPLSPNGKLDRAALPEPARPAAAAARTAPRDQLERAIAEIWEDVLETDESGIDDDFFTLGGHSLLAMSVLVRIEAATGVKLMLRSLFESPTIRGLADAVREADG